MDTLNLLLVLSCLCLIQKTASQARGGPYECVKILFIEPCKENTADDPAQFDIQVKRVKSGRCITGTWSTTQEIHDGLKVKVISSQEDGGQFKHFYTLDVDKPLTAAKAHSPNMCEQLKTLFEWNDAPYPVGNYTIPCLEPCLKSELTPELPYGHFVTKIIVSDENDKMLSCMNVESRVDPKPHEVAGKKVNVKK